MNDWKLSPMPIVMLRGWGFHESPHRLSGITLRGLFALRRRRTTSREALPNGDRRHLHSG
jgi:hypothetical protein